MLEQQNTPKCFKHAGVEFVLHEKHDLYLMTFKVNVLAKECMCLGHCSLELKACLQ